MCPFLRRVWLAARIAGVLGAALSLPSNVWAGSARDYLNAPIDSWLAFYNAGYAASVTPEDGLDITARTRTNVVSQSVVLTRTMDYWGRTGGVSIVLPYLDLESISGPDRTAVHGVSDVGFLWQMNIFGGPALSREAFASFVPQTFSSFHLFVGTPLGEYEPSRALNPSANRWTVRPTVNFSYTPDRGWTWLETYVSAAAFTANDAFQVGGASRLTQHPYSSSKAMRAATSPHASGCRRTPITTPEEKRASTGCLRAMPPTPCGWVPAWARISGPAAIWC